MSYYILKDRSPVKCENAIQWAKWFDKNENRRVAETLLENGTIVSTVFLGIDHGFMDSKPLLFETMIFGGPNDQYQERYSTWELAEEGHKESIKLAHLPLEQGQ